MMETCPVCSCSFSNGDIDRVEYPTTYHEQVRGEVPAIIRFCGRCQVGVAFPMLSDSRQDELYAGGKYWNKAAIAVPSKAYPVPFALAQARWRSIERFLKQSRRIKGIRLLDVGAGHGYIGLLASASSNISIGNYTAVEPDPAMRQYLQQMWNVWKCKQRLDAIASMDQVTGNYDVVILSNILEHLDNPQSLIKSAVALLSLGGLLFVDVPNQDYLFKKDVFPHLLFFSPSSLEFLLKKEDLDIVLMGVWGRSMYKSPLYEKAALSTRLIGKMVEIFYRFLPGKFLVRFYTWYFGVDHPNLDGTWIRALCRRK